MKEYTTREVDERLGVLDQYERRCVIRFLRETETGEASMSDVVSHLQKQEEMADTAEEIAVTLHHNHVPKLASIDAFEFDSEREVVRYRGDDLVETLIDATPETHESGA